MNTPSSGNPKSKTGNSTDNLLEAMKKHVVIILLFSLLWKSGFSQQTYFNNRYNFGVAENGLDILPNDSGYFLLSGIANNSFHRSILISSLDFNGNVLWSKNFTDSIHDLYAGGPGNLGYYDSHSLILAASNSENNTQGLICKFNLNGDTIWVREYGDTLFQSGWDVKRIRDGGLVLVCNVNNADPNGNVELIKTDSLGNVQWQKYYGGAQYDIAVSLDTCVDGGFIMAGQTSSFGPNAGSSCGNMYCLKTDSIGNLQWQKGLGNIYADDAWSVVSCKDSSFIFAGVYSVSDPSSGTTCDVPISQAWLVKLNLNGDTVWTRKYGSPVYNTGLFIVRELADGSLIAAGQRGRDTIGFSQGLVMKVASNGDSLWYRTYENLHGFDSDNFLRDIRPTADGGFIACGYIFPQAPDTGTQDTWILKIDSNGCEQLNCTLNNFIHENSLSTRLSIYPNPSTGYFQIDNNSGFKLESISVFNAVGQLQYSKIGQINSLNLEDSPPGIYFYQIELENHTWLNGRLSKQ